MLFNADSNLTLTQIRAEDRVKYVKNVSYISHIGYVALS